MTNRIESIFSELINNGYVEDDNSHLNLPKKEYCIYFTPRSGSSWLTEMLCSTGRLGYPEEWFNPENLPGILKEIKSLSVNRYMDSVRRLKQSANGTFGFEVSFFQMQLVQELTDFMGIFPETMVPFYLYRSDFVAQGISLYKAVSTGYFHSTQENKRVKKVKYDSEEIKKWILHIMQQEWGFERHFEKTNTRPIRVTYEAMRSSPESIVSEFYFQIHKEILPSDVVINSAHKPISNRSSETMVTKFKKENEDFVRHWSACRGKARVW